MIELAMVAEAMHLYYVLCLVTHVPSAGALHSLYTCFATFAPCWR